MMKIENKVIDEDRKRINLIVTEDKLNKKNTGDEYYEDKEGNKLFRIHEYG